MNKFIATENFDFVGGEGEKIVWDRVKDAFTGRECIGYSRYPLFSQNGLTRKEPDILVVDKELGLIIIEVKGIRIDNIESINGSMWYFKDFYIREGSPYEQAERQMYALLSRSFLEPKLFGHLKARVLVGLPYVTRVEWKQKGFYKNPSCPPIIFKDDLGKVSLFQCISNAQLLQNGTDLDYETWKILLCTITGENNLIKDDESFFKEGSKAYIINKVEKDMYDIDLQQESIGKVIPPGPQRIRGIAGSGKTLLLCERAAHMHLKHPEWNIALVFFTRSLYDTMIKTIDMWMKHFTNGTEGYDGKNSNLKVLHAWGAKDRMGLYREICIENSVPFLNTKDVKNKSGKNMKPNEGLAFACKELLYKKNDNITQVYDAILIDEGQDLVVDDSLKFDGRQPFYWMAYQALKSVDENNTKLRRMIWAYDEAQRLDGYEIPTAKSIFGEDPDFREMFARSYKGGVKKTEVMRKCYRTPGHILTTAHSMGMGLLRDKGMICGFTTKEDWQNIGYKVESGSFKSEGQRIVIKRPKENSPNPIEKYYSGKVLDFKTYASFNRVLEELVKNINNDIEDEGLNASRHILVVILGKSSDARKLEQNVAIFIKNKGIDIYIPTALHRNIINPIWPDVDKDKFWEDGAVTISRIHRAKGNEASMVYIVGLENVAKEENDISLRNQLFVALTRSKCWVKIFGVGDYPLYDELNRCIEANGVFNFIFKRPQQDINDLENEEIEE